MDSIKNIALLGQLRYRNQKKTRELFDQFKDGLCEQFTELSDHILSMYKHKTYDTAILWALRELLFKDKLCSNIKMTPTNLYFLIQHTKFQWKKNYRDCGCKVSSKTETWKMHWCPSVSLHTCQSEMFTDIDVAIDDNVIPKTDITFKSCQNSYEYFYQVLSVDNRGCSSDNTIYVCDLFKDFVPLYFTGSCKTSKPCSHWLLNSVTGLKNKQKKEEFHFSEEEEEEEEEEFNYNKEEEDDEDEVVTSENEVVTSEDEPVIKAPMKRPAKKKVYSEDEEESARIITRKGTCKKKIDSEEEDKPAKRPSEKKVDSEEEDAFHYDDGFDSDGEPIKYGKNKAIMNQIIKTFEAKDGFDESMC